MSKYIDADQIRAEIKAQKNDAEGSYVLGDDNNYWYGKAVLCDELLAFLDTLPEQPVEGLEEAAEKYADGPECSWVGTSALEAAFKAGAEWKKEQFEKNRLAACDAQTEEEYERETAFADEIILKEHRHPTFSDAINYGMRLQKEQTAKETPDAELDGTSWLGWRKATKKLNEANCGIHFFGNLFPYLRKKGELDGLCRKNGREWEYDTDGIIKKARANKFNYK